MGEMLMCCGRLTVQMCEAVIWKPRSYGWCVQSEFFFSGPEPELLSKLGIVLSKMQASLSSWQH